MSDLCKSPWAEWKTVRVIGRGSFGTVYEIRRMLVDGTVETAAMKVITLPQNPGDVEELRGEGYDDESITATFQSHLKSIVAEYTLMRKLDGSANVVNCKDIRYIQHDDGMGWDIFIRMELLTPLLKALPDSIDEKTVVKLARDICAALVLCKRYGIVHRDIKPQNIFISANGDYKLGDFGIAKTVEKTMGGTKIGTYKYMAPEVYNNQPYGSAADIYSLGLVMYWLLNERRMPFMPLPPAKILAGQDEAARQRRLSGEPLPTPAHGSTELKRIVLKACAYDPKERYHTADEMLADLNALGGERVFAKLDEKALEDDATEITDVTSEKTVGVFGTDRKEAAERHDYRCQLENGSDDVPDMPSDETAQTVGISWKNGGQSVEKPGDRKKRNPGKTWPIAMAIMPTHRSLNQGSYNENGHNKSDKWICPNDETINTGEYCIICGCARPTTENVIPKPTEPEHPRVVTPPDNPPKPPKNIWSIVAVICIVVIAAIAFLIHSKNNIYGYYVSESGYYSVSIEKDGVCYWYQDNTRFTGTYEKNDSSLQLSVIGKSHYANTTFLATIEKQGLRIAGGTVNSELFIEGSKTEEIRNIDQQYDKAEAANDIAGTSGTKYEDPNGIKRVVAGEYHVVAIRNDGTVFATGENKDGQCDLDDWTGIVDVALGNYVTLGLREDNTVCFAGSKYNNLYEESQSWEGIVKITGNGSTIAGMRFDGTVVTNGLDTSAWANIVDISAGDGYLVGLQSDGTAVAVGKNDDGQCNVQNWENLSSISAGSYHTVGLKKDGTVVAAGQNDDGQCNVQFWNNIVAVDTGIFYTVAMTNDGRAIAAGPSYICAHIPEESSVVNFSAGPWHVLFLHSDGTVSAYGGSRVDGTTSAWRNIDRIAAGNGYSVGVEKNNSIIACANSDYEEQYIIGWLPDKPKNTVEEEPVPVETIIVTQPTTPKGYYSYVDGDWGNKIKIGDATVGQFVFNSPLVDCKEMTININVEMKAGTHCNNWDLWGRENGKMKKLGEIYLADGDGATSKTFSFSPAISIDAVAVTPTISGGYSWSIGLSVTDVWLNN